jgi:hypothetical protein
MHVVIFIRELCPYRNQKEEKNKVQKSHCRVPTKHKMIKGSNHATSVLLLLAKCPRVAAETIPAFLLSFASGHLILNLCSAMHMTK